MKYLFIPLLLSISLSLHSQNRASSFLDSLNHPLLEQNEAIVDTLAVGATGKLDGLKTKNTEGPNVKKSIADSLAIAVKSDTLKNQWDSLHQKLPRAIEMSALDSLSPQPIHELDSLHRKVKTVVSFNLDNPLDTLHPGRLKDKNRETLRLDSVNHKIRDLLPIDSLKTRGTGLVDSLRQKLNPQGKALGWQTKVDSAQQSVVDTLDVRVKRKLSSLKAKQDSLGILSNRSQEKLPGVTSQLSNKLNEVNPVKDLGAEDALPNVNTDLGAVPGLNNPAHTLPAVPVDLPVDNLSPVEGLDGDLVPKSLKSIGSADIPGIEGPALQNAGLPGLENGLGDLDADLGLDINEQLKDVADLDLEQSIANPLETVEDKIDNPLEDLGSVDELGAVKEEAGQFKEISAELENYSEDLEAVRQGNYEGVEEKVMDHVDQAGEINTLMEQKAGMEEYQLTYEEKLKIMRELQDQEVFRAKLEEALKKEAPNHFVARQENLVEAQKLLSAYKKKYSEVTSIKDLTTGKARVVRRERLADRLHAGMDLEFARMDINFLDIAPYLGYELTKRWHFKAGYAWRFEASIEDGLEISTQDTRGMRTSLSFLAVKGFMAVAGYEKYWFTLPVTNPGEKPSKRTDLGVVGLRKRYTIFRSLQGDGQVLYNFSISGERPYRNRINLRFGFFVDFKNK